MKIFYLLILSFIPFNVFFSDDPIEKIAALIKNADSTQISSLFDESVTLTILGEENVYFKGQAEVIIEKFFKSYTPSSVKIIHKVDSNPSYRFAVFETKTNNGNFRISVQMRSTGSGYVISEFKAEESKL